MAKLDLSMLGSNTPTGSQMYNKYKGTNIGKEGLAGGDLSTQLANFKSTGASGANTVGGFLQGLNGMGS
jgi:hypothetical protein